MSEDHQCEALHDHFSADMDARQLAEEAARAAAPLAATLDAAERTVQVPARLSRKRAAAGSNLDDDEPLKKQRGGRMIPCLDTVECPQCAKEISVAGIYAHWGKMHKATCGKLPEQVRRKANDYRRIQSRGAFCQPFCFYLIQDLLLCD